MNDTILTAREGAVATLTLNRPDALNVLDFSMIDALVANTAALAADASIRCVVVRGAGKHFMAGGDLRAFASRLGVPAIERQQEFKRTIQHLHGAIETLQRMPQTVVAAVHGAVAGFGLSLMCACDLVVASESAYFTSAYRHIGLTPDGGCTYSLPRIVGTKKAMEIVLLGERFDAMEALALGLVNRVVPHAELDGAVAAIVESLVNGPAGALARAKRLVNQSLSRTLSEQLEAEATSFGECTASGDFDEGISAFLEKRAAQFGRDAG
jgi:2-(1,2-epoxy-1,2-dihydrophenyl)acetyl-CoA isomerase